MSDFSDRPFVAGSLIGLRAFAVDDLGRLEGPSHGGIFKPGENVGKCVRSRNRFSSLGLEMKLWQMESDLAKSLGTPPPARPSQQTAPPDHQVGNAKCSCGFYAYFDGTNTYASKTRVSAVVEGYGVCTVGERGFRAEKMKIVALVLPKRPWFRLVGWSALTAFNTFHAIWNAPTDEWWRTTISAVAAALGVLTVVMICLGTDWRRGIRTDLIRRNYPDVPVYRNEKAALRKHPLTPPPSPPEPTPDDEGFWTMAVPR